MKLYRFHPLQFGILVRHYMETTRQSEAEAHATVHALEDALQPEPAPLLSDTALQAVGNEVRRLEAIKVPKLKDINRERAHRSIWTGNKR